MHSSRMRTARSLIISLYLVVSHAHPSKATTHPPPGATTHPLGATMHTLPPGATTYTPRSNHACPPGATMHAPRGATLPPPPRATMHTPPVNRMTNRCKNITLPQTSFAGGNNEYDYGKEDAMTVSTSDGQIAIDALGVFQLVSRGLSCILQLNYQ